MQKIIERQNEERMLKVQFAAGCYFNRAETLNNITAYAVLINLLLFIPFPDSWRPFIPILTVAIDLIVCLLIFEMNRCVKAGASLRNFFDSYVLDIGYNEYTKDDRSKLFDIAFSITNKNSKLAKVQLNNTGHDSPPGVKNWYEFPSAKSKSEAIYICQKANAWWDQKLNIFRIIRFVIFLLITILTAVILRLFFHASWLDLFLGTLSIMVKLIERIIAAYHYYVLSKKIDGALETISCNPKILYESDLQKKIEARRSIPILGSNRAHKKLAKNLSTKYNETTN